MRIIIVMLITLGIFGQVSPAQNPPISEQLKQASCNFKFTLNKKRLDVTDQIITLRAVVGHYGSDRANYAVSYSSYHLEIAYVDVKINPSKIFTVEFYDNDLQLINEINLEDPIRKAAERKQNLGVEGRYLSINLQGIPLFLLDQVSLINIRSR